MFKEPEESANLPALATWERREVAVYVMRKARIDSRHGQPNATGEQHFGRRLDEDRLAPMQHTEPDRRGTIIGDEPAVHHD